MYVAMLIVLTYLTFMFAYKGNIVLADGLDPMLYVTTVGIFLYFTVLTFVKWKDAGFKV